MTTSPAARPASTVVVLRPSDAAYQVLLVRRNDRVAFMAGAFVFPGGRVDAADHVSEEPPNAARERRFPDLSAADEAAYRRAAVRELKEEAAVSVETDDLIPFAHWVTPADEPRRYDTRFFLTLLPPGQVARHDEGETTELAWCTPAESIAHGLAGRMNLPPPTWTTLRQLERHSTLHAVLHWARTTSVVRIQPNLLSDGSTRLLTIPGDPSFPTIEGWVVPEETRFVLEEGRGWLPVRP